MPSRRNLIEQTPAYIWGQLAPARERASAYPGGLVDLSVGSPVDPVPEIVRTALAAGANAPGYPSAAARPQLRDAIVGWYQRRRGVDLTEANVVPTNGSKEFISLLPFWLGLGPDDVIVEPRVHYPNYGEGGGLVGARMFASTDPQQWPESASLIWLNSPGNPDGVVNDVGYLRAAVARARQIGALIVQDECYAELGWEGRWRSERIPSILDPRVVGGDFTGVLACYSLSKQSNMAGYRAGFVAGDARVVAGLVNVRKTAGLAVNAPVQSAMIAALGDDEHVREQKARYGRRREILLAALESTRFRVEGSSAGLYLWCTDGADAWDGVDWFAGHGILVSPGHFYGPDAARYVRISLTATDASVQEAARRLGAD